MFAEPQADDAEPLDAYSATVTAVAERLLPSVASLRVRRSNGRWSSDGAGSAVALSSDGILVTSAHVVEGMTGGEARFADGTEHGLELVGKDPLSDLALIQAGEGDLRPAAVADADRLRIGQLVIAVGNPLGYAGSVTAGVVSGLGRSLATRQGTEQRVVENVIQTDAALNPGNSGGALADSHARLIGINTAVAGAGLGLAVPLNATTRRILDSLHRLGRVQRGYLGVAGMTQPLPPEWAASLGRKAAVGVMEVVAESPAASAGVRPGDLIVAAGGEPVGRTADLQDRMIGESSNQTLELQVVRGEVFLRLAVTPTHR
ncbi:MAG: trypsin-like peptidase domain-containing protein [Candidatus Dormibacteraeota bacterium]|uniref:Trypsin-like peptidase domain-containing protein n=1 Tax=Candidatus Dormiibacter inghamiae TaxID=3127013 RepID=A0A934K624_9BACT|nr:trypsin-like peptidase domain-containing protein [Candidatus Dormibacteraeota bacterium]MBJ7604974.1 trypsin-like peptidase domain-containing protein [Candidatus Dormibacteraeota bacterium]